MEEEEEEEELGGGRRAGRRRTRRRSWGDAEGGGGAILGKGGRATDEAVTMIYVTAVGLAVVFARDPVQLLLHTTVATGGALGYILLRGAGAGTSGRGHRTDVGRVESHSEFQDCQDEDDPSNASYPYFPSSDQGLGGPGGPGPQGSGSCRLPPDLSLRASLSEAGPGKQARGGAAGLPCWA